MLRPLAEAIRSQGVLAAFLFRIAAREMNGHRATYTIQGFAASTEIGRARGRIRHGGIPLMAELSPVACDQRPFADYLGPLKKNFGFPIPVPGAEG